MAKLSKPLAKKAYNRYCIQHKWQMNTPQNFPRDENGEILRRVHERGDDLTQPRIVDFCFIFPERRQALAFAETVDDPSFELCVSYYEQREMWQVKAKRRMVPTHSEITRRELELTVLAERVGGEADGWGFMSRP